MFASAILSLDLQQVVSQSLSFLLLLWVLRRFAWKPLLAMLDERRARIERSFQEAEQRQAELDRLREEYGRRIAVIEEEARGKIQESVKEGKRVAAEIQEQARAQGSALITKSKETIELEVAKAKITLRNQLAALAMDAVERILHEKLDDDTDKRLVDEVLKELERERA